MNVDPVLIDDDDVDMEPVVILDEDDEKIICDKAVGARGVPSVETIILDDESPIITRETVKNNGAKIINKSSLKKSETSFVNNLKNNRLMDKIVRRCINMDNSTGMPRVVYKTMLPLYRDTNNIYKESELFRALLKKTYKLLMRDPDHKFLHIKTLCEELKSGWLRRKVPFVTLTTNLKNNGSQCDHKELTNSSREINQNNAKNIQIHKVTRKRVGGTGTKRKEKKSKSRAVNTKYRMKTRGTVHVEKEKTDIIDLDDSDIETLDRSENDVIIIEETESSDQRNDNVKTVLQGTLEEAECEKGNDNVNTVLQETLEAESKKGNHIVQETLEADSNKENKVVQATTEEDSNKENNDESGKSSDNEMDYELLIPKTHVEVVPIQYEVSHNSTNNLEIAGLEKQIADYKQMIDKLEEAEVTSEGPLSSAYFLCSKYKEKVVSCYKQICEMKGNCKDIVKRREIRLIVAEGHPPGPAKRLEEFLNSTIDRTGAVEFPDFSDVVKCVVESNLADNLAWNRQQVMQEAVALFRQCGQALQKQRQKREYRDLLSLIRDQEETDDPAEKDPILQAKLEVNKLSAKIKEDEILERYVSMENNVSPKVGIPQVGNAVEFESDQESSGSDSESEENITLPSSLSTSTVNNQPDTEQCSRSNISLNLLRTNNIIVTSTFRNNHCDTGQGLKTNNVVVDYLKANSMLMNLLTTSKIAQNHEEETATNEKQYATGESQIINDAISNNDSDKLPTNTSKFTPDTMHNECETFQCSNKKEIDNFKLGLTITETVVGFNNATINENSDMSSINNMRNFENTELQANDEPCNVNDVLDNVSSTTDGIEHCDSSISKEGFEIKTKVKVKREPLDIQNMLDELGDSFVCQVFDIEDPFLVIEISSDGFTDDDEL